MSLRLISGRRFLWIAILTGLGFLLTGSQSDYSDHQQNARVETGKDGDDENSDNSYPDEDLEVEHYRTHYVSAHGELGQGWSVGAGYSIAGENLSRHGSSWAATGLGIFVARRGDSDFGLLSLLIFRFGATGHGGGFSGEVSAGLGGTSFDSILGVGAVGIYYSLREVEFGYSFRVPIGALRPSWLGGHFFSVRVHSPLLRTER